MIDATQKAFAQVTALVSAIGNIITLIIYMRIKEPSVHHQFIKYMLLSNSLAMASIVVNTIVCDDHPKELGLITSYLYLSFNQIALGWMAMITFAQFFILTSQNNDFIPQLQRSSRSLIWMTFLFPLVLGVGLIFSELSNSQTFCAMELQRGVFSTVSLVIPTSLLLIIITLYDIYQIKWINKYNESFVQSYTKELYQLPIILWALFVPVLICEIAFNIKGTVEQQRVYTVIMILLNLTGMISVYFFAVNPTINTLLKWKISLLEEIITIKLERTTGTGTGTDPSRTNTKLANSANGRWSNFIRATMKTTDYRSLDYESFSANRL